MTYYRIFAVYLLLSIISQLPSTAQSNEYPWLADSPPENRLCVRIAAPPGYHRIKTEAGSFGNWLQNLPLKKGQPPVYLFNDELKTNQSAQAAVIEIDVGKNDLQQCADAVIRLRAEYLFSKKRFQDIHFNFTSGFNAEYKKWIQGYRPEVKGNSVRWKKQAAGDSSYGSFKRYLRTVFMYAGSYSLSRELEPVHDIHKMKIGDIFIQGGFPGHAVIVVDMAVNPDTGENLFMLAQSYMPAQDIHILKNPAQPDLSPWYPVDFGDVLITPEWTFRREDLKCLK
ncbi:DUF4846 domain-containing protein [candidate division KSB1 bacterium]|nr:DUF4846 domain-containing protein [candidate division KSB1 bacterium]